MGALNPMDMLKEHKNVLLPLLAAVIIILGLGYFMSREDSISLLDPLPGGSESNGAGSTKRYDSAPEMTLKDGVDYYATIKTNYGEFEVFLYSQDAPKTVNNFVFLSNEGFYDGLTFHRVIEDFMIQGGDPEGNGSGGPGYQFSDEINPNALGLDRKYVKNSPFLSMLYDSNNAATMGYSPNSLREHADDTLAEFYDDVIGYDYDYSLNSHKFTEGVIAMANAGPSTNGSQFFVTVTGSASQIEQLEGRHTVFGRVTSGMEVVDEIVGVSTDAYKKPVDDVIIEQITISER
jgi:peptidyl-prolyl cis-trans isomerase A (cyclophilin A)